MSRVEHFVKPKYLFVLEINPAEVEALYGLGLTPDFESPLSADEGITFLSEISEKEAPYLNFYHATNHHRRWVVSMFDAVRRMELPKQTDIPCFSCRAQFSHSPIGCPLEFVPSLLRRSYYSELLKSMVDTRRELTFEEVEKIEHQLTTGELDSEEYQLCKRGFFWTDGIFCSFSCAMDWAWIHRHDPRYRHAVSLVYHLYYYLQGERAKEIPRTSFRLLKDNGGHLSRDELQDQTRRFIPNGNVYFHPPVMRPVGMIYEEILHL